MQPQPRPKASLQRPEVHEQEALDTSNDAQPWTDEELSYILKMIPSQETYLLLAQTLKRTPESIEAIFRWAAED